eukprot:6041036-Alexandrium_andersonii.AAC.1
MQDQVRTIAGGCQPNRVRWRSVCPPRAPHGPGEATAEPTQMEHLNLLLTGAPGTGGGTEGNPPPPVG